MANNPDHYGRGTIVGPTQEAEDMDLVRNRKWGTVTSHYPVYQMVTVRWHGNGKFEKWHVDLLEVIDRPEKQSKTD